MASSGGTQFTDPYGYKCTIQKAEPYGLCPDDHSARTGNVTITDNNGVRCNFTDYNVSTGLCPQPVTTSAAPNTTTTPPVRGPHQIYCSLDPNTGQVIKDACYWTQGATAASAQPYHGHDKQLGCDWRDDGKDSTGTEEVFNCR